MQFLVPQFIDTEDKIFGPISTRQFVEILVGFILMYVCYKLSTFWLFAIEAIVIFGLIIIFAFVKINGQFFHLFVLSLIQTMRRPRLKIWLKQVTPSKIMPGQATTVTAKKYIKPTVTTSRLTELSLVVDTGGIYKPEEEKAELTNHKPIRQPA